MILRPSVRIAPRREWNVSTWRSPSASVSFLPATSFIFGSLLDDLQQEFLRGFVVRGGGERIEHVTAARRAVAPGVEGARGAQPGRGVIVRARRQTGPALDRARAVRAARGIHAMSLRPDCRPADARRAARAARDSA